MQPRRELLDRHEELSRGVYVVQAERCLDGDGKCLLRQLVPQPLIFAERPRSLCRRQRGRDLSRGEE